MLRARLAIRGDLDVVGLPTDGAAEPSARTLSSLGGSRFPGDHRATPIGMRLHLQFRVEEGASGRTLEWAYESGREEELSAMVDRSILSILGTLGKLPPSHDRRVAAHKMQASSSRSLRLFREALADLGASQVASARAKLEHATEVDPDHATLWENLAAVYAHQGLETLAEETAVHAEQLAAGMSWEPQRSAAARTAEVRGDWRRAVELLKTLCQRFPHERHYGLRLVGAMIRLGDLVPASHELDRLRRVTGDHTALDLLEITVLMRSNRLAEAEALARRVAEHDPGGLFGDLGATGQRRLLNIHLRQGRLAEAQALVENLSSSFGRLELRQRALMLLDHAALLQKQGQLDDALGLYQRAETTFLQLGDRTGLVGLLNRKAHFLFKIGELESADADLRRAHQQTDSPGLEDKRLVTLCLLAQVAVAMDRLEEAEAHLAAARALKPVPQDPRRFTLWLRTAADVHLARGDLDRAAEHYAKCVAFSSQVGDIAAASHAHVGLARIAGRNQQFAAARAHALKAVEGFADLSSVPDQLAARCEVAELALENGDLRTAEVTFQEVYAKAAELSLVALGDRARKGLESAGVVG